jgi:hypothetical protein
MPTATTTREDSLSKMAQNHPHDFTKRHFFSGGCWNGRIMYLFCRQNDIVVGGTVQRGNESEAITPADEAAFERILSNARAMFDGRLVDCVAV